MVGLLENVIVSNPLNVNMSEAECSNLTVELAKSAVNVTKVQP